MSKLAGTLVLLLAMVGSAFGQSQNPLRIVITEGVVEPLPFAAPSFVAENPGAQQLAQQITDVVLADLTGSGLFREVPSNAHIARITNFDSPVNFTDWTPINVQALVTGAVSTTSDDRVVVKFRLWDIYANAQIGKGQQFVGPKDSWRRMAHKVSDQVYSALTGESGYFDSRIVFVSEAGPKNARRTQIAVVDQDGANPRYLTEDNAIVLAPRWSPDNSKIIYTSYESGRPQVVLMDVRTLNKRSLGDLGPVSFAPRFSPDGRQVLLSLTDGTNTDIYAIDLASGQRRRLTDSPAIETAPSYSPDGTQIVFESDRGGSQQIYVMPASGGEGQRISFGEQGSYGTPVWSPRGDLIAFTKILNGQFHIGVMSVDGQRERLLTRSFLDEGPSWSPNGRVITFFRETPGSEGAPSIYTVDITSSIDDLGGNLRKVPTPSSASDPNWSALLP